MCDGCKKNMGDVTTLIDPNLKVTSSFDTGDITTWIGANALLVGGILIALLLLLSQKKGK